MGLWQGGVGIGQRRDLGIYRGIYRMFVGVHRPCAPCGRHCSVCRPVGAWAEHWGDLRPGHPLEVTPAHTNPYSPYRGLPPTAL